MNEGLLQTKLFVPQLRPELVARPRLVERLDQGLQHGRKLSLVSAPAGFGKTTLVCEWLAEGERPVAWLSLDEGDNDQARFLAYFVAALQTIAPSFGERLFGLIRSPQPPPVESMLTALVNEITTLPERIIVVLDDYHLIDAEPVDQILAFLLEHLPQQVHLAIATREEPDFPLARLRALNEVTELRAPDLRFADAETAEFLNLVMGLDISAEDVVELEKRTEGWIAGLQMAALSMQGRRDQSSFIEALSGSHHFMLDYLVEEILEGQPEDVQEFLLATSILKRMTAALCDAVTGDGDSQLILRHLEQANFFLVALDEDRRWYRYHHLFAGLLQSLLRQRKAAEEIRELHRRAGRWHRRQGHLEEAMVHTMAAQDFEQAALMIEENYANMFARSEVPVLLAWINKLPQEIVRDHPWIDVYRANTLALASQLDDVDFLLEGVEERIKPDDPQSSALLGHIAAIQAFSANLRGDAARAIELATLAERDLPVGASTARGMAAYARADANLAVDEIDPANQTLLEMVRFGQEARQSMVVVPALCDLASIKKVQGQLHQARELYDKAYHWMREQKQLDSRVRCAYEFGLADLLREQNQVEAAYEHAMTGIETRQRLGGYLVVGDIALMRILQARGDAGGVLNALQRAEAFMQTYEFQLSVTIEFKTARVALWLALGEVEMASRWAEQCRGGTEREQIVLARLRLAQGRAADAQRLLAAQRVRAEAGGRSGRLIEILGLMAVALNGQGKSDEAAAALSQALFLAQPQGYKRLFLDMGRPLSEVLQLLVGQHTISQPTEFTQVYERELLNTFLQEETARRELAVEPAFASRAPAEPMLSALTDRELEVLQLLAEGLSNKQIAAKLVVAPSTVKQHLKNIYSKLDVHSRTQAVARGVELNLL